MHSPKAVLSSASGSPEKTAAREEIRKLPETELSEHQKTTASGRATPVRDARRWVQLMTVTKGVCSIHGSLLFLQMYFI
jgi:hypothetical protein